MYVEMSCKCESSFSIDSEGENSDAIWHLIWRFTNAHVSCGYVVGDKPIEEDNETFKKRSIRPRKVVDEDEEYEDEE